MMILRQKLGDQNAQKCCHCDICDNHLLQIELDHQNTQDIEDWLIQRTIKTSPIRQYNISEGIAIFDGKLRSTLFIKFMQERMRNTELTHELLELITKKMELLTQQYQINCVIPIPSRTWCMRDKIAQFIAAQINVPVLLDYLHWHEIPDTRQGELLNNDQRRYNVSNKMAVQLSQVIPRGNILLLDDYIGSGATIKEAARALRKQARVTQKIVPFTIATVKWRLGKRGMI